MLGWGGGDGNVPDTCTHVGCYARCPITVSYASAFLEPRNVAPTKSSWPLANGSWRLLVANLHRNLMMRFLPVAYWHPFKLGHLATLMVLSDGRKLEKIGLANVWNGWWSSIPMQSLHAKDVKVALRGHSSWIGSGSKCATPVDNNFQREGQRESSLEVSLAWTVASSERRPCVRQPRQVMQTKPTRKIEKKRKKRRGVSHTCKYTEKNSEF